MISLRLLAVALVVVCAPPARAQEVIRLSWPTRLAAPPPEVTPQTALYLPLLRAGVARMPESDFVPLALRYSSALGLSEAEAAQLGELVTRRYAAIAASPVFKAAPSSLAYCLSETRPDHGLALLYRPLHSDARTPVIVFLHGDGGSFLWYQHQLAEWFPGHLILCPAYGINPSAISPAYLLESLAAASARLKHPLAKPTLIGLSSGGFGAIRAYATRPEPYEQLIVLAAYPPDDAFRAWPASARSGFIVGELEYYVKDGGFADYSRSLSARSAQHRSAVIPKAGHFFLLTHPAQTRRHLQSWMK